MMNILRSLGHAYCAILFCLVETVLRVSVQSAIDNLTMDSSSNIELGQNATYKCSVNDTHIAIAWNINNDGTIPADFTVTGLGTPSSTLTIPGEIQYNNTMVKCVASGLVDGTSYFDSRESTLKIQGRLAPVSDLSCVLMEGLIQCNWSPPFSLTNISSYVINITNLTFHEHLIESTVNTSWNYNVDVYDNYIINIVGNNTVGPGEPSMKSVVFTPAGNFTYDRVSYSYSLSVGGVWNVTLTIKNGTLFHPDPLYIIAYLTKVDGDPLPPIINSGDGQYEGTNLIQRIDLGLIPNNTHWTLVIGLIYPSFRIYTPVYDFKTFDVRYGTWSLDDTVIGRISFTCHFVEGSTSKGCIVTYICDQTSCNGNITINRDPNDISAIGYVYNFITSVYNISYYDQDDTVNPAYQLTEQLIIGVNFTIATSSVSISTSTPSLPPDSPQPTGAGGDTSIIAISSSVFGSVLLLFIICVVILFIFVIKKISRPRNLEIRRRSSIESTECKEHYQIEMKSGYTHADDLLSNYPQAPPPINITVPSDVSSPPPDDDDDPSHNRLYRNNGDRSSHQLEESYSTLNHSMLNRNTGTKTPQPDSEYSTIPAVDGHTVNGENSDSNVYSKLNTPNKEGKQTISNKTELTHADLTVLVVPRVSIKWYEVGLALAITPDILEEMEENKQGVSDVFKIWEDNPIYPFTWDTLIMILRTTTVNEPQLAEQLERELKE